MGNRSSNKKDRKHATDEGHAVKAFSKIDEVREPTMDSYDKLIAWLTEMAENDNMELDRSKFVKHISRTCPNSQRRSKSMSLRQHSASCDSNSSSEPNRYTRSSKSYDNSLYSHMYLRPPGIQRQRTIDDDLEDPDLQNASIESLYDNSDRESDLETPSCSGSVYVPKETMCKSASDTFQGRSRGKTFRSKFSSSLSTLFHKHFPRQLTGLRRKSYSMLELSPMRARTQQTKPSPQEEKEPPATATAENTFLEDTLLDGNLADILFSVEALWPK